MSLLETKGNCFQWTATYNKKDKCNKTRHSNNYICVCDSKCPAGQLFDSPCPCGPPQDLVDGLTGKWTCDKQPQNIPGQTKPINHSKRLLVQDRQKNNKTWFVRVLID